MSQHKVESAERKKTKRWPRIILSVAILVLLGLLINSFIEKPQPVENKVELNLQFDISVLPQEQDELKNYVTENKIEMSSPVNVSAKVNRKIENSSLTSKVYVPVTNFNSVRQKITTDELKNQNVLLDSTIDETERIAVAKTLELDLEKLTKIEGELKNIDVKSIAFTNVDNLSGDIKLLEFDGVYYLDNFTEGALFRELTFAGDDSGQLNGFKFETLTKSDVFKVNTTGVTALTRLMIRKLAIVKDPLYFSEKIGEFLADADLTHVSNEVSFKSGCTYNDSSFCSPPQFIETLKASGVDLVELTGNHNNDFGSQYNTDTINQYHELGWGTVGGGLNTAEAAKPFVAEQKDSKITFLAYNFPNTPGDGTISGENTAGANSFDFERIKNEIATAKESSNYVIVNIQYWECEAYPDGYIEYPICDKPIGKQEADFKQVVDLGADMVIGTSAHQPQTYELYNGKPIYYGLGNLYFEQYFWPGTERGIVLTHYFVDGKLIQTKLTPTIYNKDLQTRKMTDEETNYLLNRLNDAR